MKAVILAAGKGERMKPFTLTTPKPLLTIQGKAILDYIFEALPAEVNEVIVVIGYLGEKIKNFLGDKYAGRRIHYVEGSEKGNAIGFLSCRPYLNEGERFLVMYGDEPQRKEEIEECLRKSFSVVCTQVPHPHLSGVALIEEGGRILEIVEKPQHPKSNWVAVGTMLVDTHIFDYEPKLHTNGEYHLSSMLDKFVRDYPVYAVAGKRRPPLNSPDDLNWDMSTYLA